MYARWSREGIIATLVLGTPYRTDAASREVLLRVASESSNIPIDLLITAS